MGSTLLHNVPPQIFLSFLHLTQNGTQFKIFGQKILDYDRLKCAFILVLFQNDSEICKLGILDFFLNQVVDCFEK